MIRLQRAAIVLGLAAAVTLPARTVGATPIAEVKHVETALTGGYFQYDFVLSNGASPVTDVGVDLYDVGLFFTPPISPISSTTAPGWDAIVGPGFADLFSLTPGASPVGTDIGPGHDLAGFRFIFDGQLGEIAFQAVFTNPDDPLAPFTFAGVSTAAPLPEPASLLFVGGGLAAVALRRYGRHREGSARA